MSIVISDPRLLSQLLNASSPLDVHDEKGNLLGTFSPKKEMHPGYRSPFSDEEIERRRQEPDGRPLADILRDLERRG